MNLKNMANMFYADMIFLVFNSKVIILLFSAIVFSSVKEWWVFVQTFAFGA